jgi:hypothetical protein
MNTSGTRARPRDLRRGALHRVYRQAHTEHMPRAALGPVYDNPRLPWRAGRSVH